MFGPFGMLQWPGEELVNAQQAMAVVRQRAEASSKILVGRKAGQMEEEWIPNFPGGVEVP